MGKMTAAEMGLELVTGPAPTPRPLADLVHTTLAELDERVGELNLWACVRCGRAGARLVGMQRYVPRGDDPPDDQVDVPAVDFVSVYVDRMLCAWCGWFDVDVDPDLGPLDDHVNP